MVSFSAAVCGEEQSVMTLIMAAGAADCTDIEKVRVESAASLPNFFGLFFSTASDASLTVLFFFAFLSLFRSFNV